MNEIIYTLDAEDDIRSILRRLRRIAGPQTARTFLDRLADAAERYAVAPDQGIPRDDVRAGYRCFLIGKYVAIYRTLPGAILILRVLPGAADAPAAFGPP